MRRLGGPCGRGRADARDADPATVSWLTGHVPEIEWGPSPFSAPPVVVVDASGLVRIVVSEDETDSLSPDVEPVTFPGFAVEDVDRRSRAIELALSLVDGRVAGEPASLPAPLRGSSSTTSASSCIARAR